MKDKAKLKKLQAVVFDMDGLMFDSERYVQKSWDIAGNILGYGPLGHHIVHTLGLNIVNREKYFKKQYGQDFPFEKFLDTYRQAYAELSHGAGVPAKEGLHRLLELLDRHHIKMAVATSSGRDHARANLKREGIEKYFRAVITGDMVKRGKPEPDVYKKACERLETEPSKAIALEDALNGIRAAYKAGMMPVMIPDLVKDSTTVDEMLFAKYDSLNGFADALKDFWREEEAEHGKKTKECRM